MRVKKTKQIGMLDAFFGILYSYTIVHKLNNTILYRSKNHVK